MSTDDQTVLGMTYPQILKRMGDAEVADRLRDFYENEVDQKLEAQDLVDRLSDQLEELNDDSKLYLEILFPLLVAHADFLRGIRTLGELVEAGREAQRLFKGRTQNSDVHYLL